MSLYGTITLSTVLSWKVPQAPSKGIPNPTAGDRNTILANIGSMRNRGFEFSVKATAVQKDKFTWTINANVTTLKNKVLRLGSDGSRILSTTGSLETTNVTQVGGSIGSIFAVPTAGVNPENGRRIFVKKDGSLVQYDQSAATCSSSLDLCGGWQQRACS